MKDFERLTGYYDDHLRQIRQTCESRGDRAVRIGRNITAIITYLLAIVAALILTPIVAEFIR